MSAAQRWPEHERAKAGRPFLAIQITREGSKVLVAIRNERTREGVTFACDRGGANTLCANIIAAARASKADADFSYHMRGDLEICKGDDDERRDESGVALTGRR